MAAQPISCEEMQCSIDDAKKRIAENWHRVQASVRDATVDAAREPGTVRVVGVTKYVDATITQWLVDAGCSDLGENRPQHLSEKAESLSGPIVWHQIGHLQRNKVRRLLTAQPIIHSVDSSRLLDEIDREAIRQGRTIDVMLEVNVSREAAKTGLPMDQTTAVVEELFERVASRAVEESQTGVRLLGFMAMAGWGTDSGEARSQFAVLRRVRDELQEKTGVSFPELSMGMSGDYPSAIAEGATMVRIGSSLFEGVLP